MNILLERLCSVCIIVLLESTRHYCRRFLCLIFIKRFYQKKIASRKTKVDEKRKSLKVNGSCSCIIRPAFLSAITKRTLAISNILFSSTASFPRELGKNRQHTTNDVRTAIAGRLITDITVEKFTIKCFCRHKTCWAGSTNVFWGRNFFVLDRLRSNPRSARHVSRGTSGA